MNTSKTVLVISYGPVPTPQYQKIEGGGMRAWGLATGLQQNGLDVTIAINGGFPQDYKSHQNIQLTTWNLDDHFKSLINDFDMVIVSYCMGDASVFIADHISSSTTLILDAYVPIYVEVSARDSKDIQTEYTNYSADVTRFNHVLKRGDYFLCANTPQKHMYTGILASLNIINPATYRDDRILVVPFGVESTKLLPLTPQNNPYSELGIEEKDFVLLWFGGLYPWFNFKPLIESVSALSKKPNFKFVLVGGKNPYNNHADFVKQYKSVRNAFDGLGLIGKSVFFVDWVDYDKRILWYQGADAVVSINQIGEENEYSWRTRIMDYVWGELPIITNGGDPLSDYLIQHDAAHQVGNSSKDMTDAIVSVVTKPSTIANIKKSLKEVKKEFYWSEVVKPILARVQEAPLPYTTFLNTRNEWGFTSADSNTKSMRSQLLSKSATYYRTAREKGIKRSLRFALSVGKEVGKSKLKSSTPVKAPRKVVLLSHPIDETGAPLVLLDIAKSFAQHMPAKRIHIVSPDIKKHMLRDLLQTGFSIHKMAANISGRIIQAQLNVNKDDFVLMNTVAVYENYRSYLYWMLERGRLNEATWFIHEDNPQLRFTNKHEAARVKKLIDAKKIHVRVPSSQTAEDYNAFFETKAFEPTQLLVHVPGSLTKTRPASDFEVLRFVTSGSPWDGRKGQFMLLNALIYFEDHLRNKNSNYRDYSLHLLAIGDDYISKQLDSIGSAFFKERYKSYKKAPRGKALEITSKANVTVCVSLNETFALFVAEGMAMGHPILRNKTSGWQEQMQDSKNGFLFDELDLIDLAKKIETLLNKKTSNESLADMGLNSQKIARVFAESDYYKQLFR